MNACSFNMFHNTGNKYIISVTNCVNFKRTIGAMINEYLLPIYSSKQGASTLEQQLIKNLTDDNSASGIDGALRKVREIYRALCLSRSYSKETILEAYLNTISFTGTIQGVQTAANEYFNKDVSQLSLWECATIASITKNPTNYNPYTNPENLIHRRNFIMYNMWQQGVISEEEALAERNKRIVVTLTANPSLPKEDEYALIYHQAEQLYDNRNVIPVVCCAGTVLAFLCFIFLLCSAGHKNGREGITPSAIHEIHLDVYTVVVAVGAFTGLYLAFGWIGMNPSMINLIVLMVLFAAEVIWCTLYFMELAIRLKMGKWWQNTILYRVFRFFGRFCKRVFRGIVKLIRGIPMVWRTALLCLAVCVVEFFGLILFYNDRVVLLFFWAIEKFILCGAITFVALMCKELQVQSRASILTGLRSSRRHTVTSMPRKRKSLII